MRRFKSTINLLTLTIALAGLAGCASDDGGGGGGTVSGGMYYGVGLYDPWYHGGYYNDVDIIVTPPERPGGRPPQATPPIAKPPSAAPRPTPSIPSTPRPSMPRPSGRR